VIYYQEEDGTVPMAVWLDELQNQPAHRAKCVEWIGMLRDNGHDLRRPRADYLRDGIYELRARFHKTRYRMLYFFYGRDRAIITHGFVKQSNKVPDREIEKSVRMKNRYSEDPESHSHWETDNE
jgi:phage-related protein